MSIVGMFLTGEYRVERSRGGTYRKGRYVEGGKETITVMGSLQPLNARELKLVSEGTRLKQLFKFYTDQAILAINTKELAKADIITINGETYKVISTENWAGTEIPYFKSIVSREPEQ